MKKPQIIGISITLEGIVSYLIVVDNSITPPISGILTAIGLGLIFKWIHLKKEARQNKLENYDKVIKCLQYV